ncbi:hypothetical protein J6590_012477 [Homalodisca vitripennis]|nr:hypothetical protein J6590_012477 [Homalodisca vitripennis]
MVHGSAAVAGAACHQPLQLKEKVNKTNNGPDVTSRLRKRNSVRDISQVVNHGGVAICGKSRRAGRQMLVHLWREIGSYDTVWGLHGEWLRGWEPGLSEICFRIQQGIYMGRW